MELFVSLGEIKVIVTKELINRGYKVKVEQANERTHVEGQHEESVQVFDGLRFQLEDLSLL